MTDISSRVQVSLCFGRHELAPQHVDLTGTFLCPNACTTAIGRRRLWTSSAELFRERNAGCFARAGSVLDDGFATLPTHEFHDELDGERSKILDALQEHRRRLREWKGHPKASMYADGNRHCQFGMGRHLRTAIHDRFPALCLRDMDAKT